MAGRKKIENKLINYSIKVSGPMEKKLRSMKCSEVRDMIHEALQLREQSLTKE